ncbi:MAG: ribonuclease J [Hyphomonadaceae bacterium]|nr:ribonuclease J [Hyphomonadaceae bacterium]
MVKNPDELVFLPLGGSGEIGMNLNLFGYGPAHDRKWIIVDIGVSFGDLTTPGIDIIMPDTEYIEAHVDNLLGIVLTHAHEDHMGALAKLWPRLKCPVYATPFTMYLVKDRLAEAGFLDAVELIEMPLRGRFDLGPFDIEYVTLTHSIPEPNALAIRTPVGMIFHTGDWKIDDRPQIGSSMDTHCLTGLKEEGILATVCDSTNALSPGHAGSEGDVREELIKLIGECRDCGVAVAGFASNIARLESVMLAAKKHDRVVCLVGRSMHRMYGAARSVGLMSGINAIIDEKEAACIPSGNVLYLCTGSQGEPRAALSRIADGSHRTVKLGEGDVVIFSSKIIPGNEKNIFALQNKLSGKGIKIVTEKDRCIHVSGHPYQAELQQMYDWTEPHISIPVHGERRHLEEHARLARSWGVRHACAPHNGEMIRLSKDGPEVIDVVPNGRLHEDSGIIVKATDESLRLRRKMAHAGHISVSLVINTRGSLISGPEPRMSGFPEGKDGELLEHMLDSIADLAGETFATLSGKSRTDEDTIESKIRSAIRRRVNNTTDKRPVVEVIAHRI